MELASMLAGEPFSDHPVSVCPVIGSFLREYNDSLDEQRRQDLYAYASKVVGSHSVIDVMQRARGDRLTAWAAERQSGWWSRLRSVSRARRAPRHKHPLEAGRLAVRAIRRHTDRTHAEALALIDELLAIDLRTAEQLVSRTKPARSDSVPGRPRWTDDRERAPVGAGHRGGRVDL